MKDLVASQQGQSVPRVPGNQTVRFFAWGLLVSWVTYGFSLFDIQDAYSVTLLVCFSLYCTVRALKATQLELPLIGVLVSTAISVAVSFVLDPHSARTWTHLAQQVLCLGVAVYVSNLPFSQLAKQLVVPCICIGGLVVAFGVYQMAARMVGLPLAYLPITNLQEYASGVQRGADREGWSRASSLFAEPSELGYFVSFLLVLGMSVRGVQGRILVGIATVGLLVSQSLSGALGFAAVMIVQVALSRKAVQLALTLLAIATGFGVFMYLAPDVSSDFTARIARLATLDMTADSNRIQRAPSNLEVASSHLWLGHGLARVAEVEPNGVAIGYLSVLIERGLIGSLAFFSPFLVGTLRSKARPRADASLAWMLSALCWVEWGASATIYFLPHWICAGMLLSAPANYGKRLNRSRYGRPQSISSRQDSSNRPAGPWSPPVRIPQAPQRSSIIR